MTPRNPVRKKTHAATALAVDTAATKAGLKTRDSGSDPFTERSRPGR
jgi:hypothetical protein